MKIAILSDSHDNEDSLIEAVRLINERAPDLVIHCGDLVSPEMLDHLADLPVRLIFGNNERRRDEVQAKALSLGFGSVHDELELSEDGKLFYIYHGTNELYLLEQITSGRYDYVLHGHTHKRRNEQIGKTRVINPGALYRAEKYSIAFLDTDTDSVEFVGVITEP